MMFALFGLGGQEVLLIFGAFLLLFGAKKIPDFAKGLGQGIKEFKKATREVTEEIHREGEAAAQSRQLANTVPAGSPSAEVAKPRLDQPATPEQRG